MSEEVRNGLMKQRRKAREKVKQLEQENQQLKERVAYLERSNDRKEETIIDLRMEQELDLYKSVLNEVREYIKANTWADLTFKLYLNEEEVDKVLEILDKVGDK